MIIHLDSETATAWESWLFQLHNVVQKNPQVDPLAEIAKACAENHAFREFVIEWYIERHGIPKKYALHPGYIYLLKAEGFHGIFSKWIGRYKIGLTTNPQKRLADLNRQQAPCPIVLVRTVPVANMLAAEQWLHDRFTVRRRHGEWFDFWNHELRSVHSAYDRLQRENKPKFSLLKTLTILTAIGVAVAVLALALLLL
ncbi:hypothetical protein WA1_49400 [Scytonema hofmannii PCC 7110]|uniref:Bacteriophage T5 Orf172 DNA-binding domain-containing protein n=1 Tax=Scytonema hofmannii PCC 7110 TaxID=128403 RepID=A0A139WQP5_9CYAN|nr:GIY-YIG nuclease family protein [Scytonema hofmannii]KYC34756.1 hypothetical protein WA1_49400 [Scytonema hofmannii PCC 7110]